MGCLDQHAAIAIASGTNWKGVSMNNSDVQGIASRGISERPITRLESTRDRLLECVKTHVAINERLMGLSNALCGGHPTNPTGEREPPRGLPSGLAEELDESAVLLAEQQRTTMELITRLSGAIPEIR